MVRTIFRPVPVDGNPLAQDTLADRRNADRLTEEMHHLFGPRQRAQIAAEDNALEAAVDQCVEIADSLVGQSPTTIGIEKPSGQASERWREPPPQPARYTTFSGALPRREHLVFGQLVLFSTENGDAGCSPLQPLALTIRLSGSEVPLSK